MKKTILIIAFVFSFMFSLAQNDMKARIEFEEAEKAYEAEDYETALKHLNETEKLIGKWTPVSSYLKIETLFALTDTGNYADPNIMSLFEEITKYMSYMNKMKSEDIPQEKYQVVYGIEKTLKSLKLEERQSPEFLEAKKEHDDKNYDSAIHLWERLVQTENSWAMRNLGLIYETKNQNDKAKEWYLKAVVKGNAQAALDLAQLDIEGGKDEARQWYEKAANLGHPKGIYGQGQYAETIEKDYKKAEQYYLKTAKKGGADGFYGVGELYLSGNNVITQSIQAAMEWYLKAAVKKNIDAMASIGWIYQNGKGNFKKDYNTAAHWYQKAIDSNSKLGNLYLGRLYSLPDNNQPQKALENYEIAAKSGYFDGMLETANFHYVGRGGITKDYAKAAKYYEEYYEYKKKNESYLDNLIDIYNRGGHGMEKDKEKAKHWKNIRRG
ncbi:MAG: tetratricopeptide repeat protein [Aequorivita sp.]